MEEIYVQINGYNDYYVSNLGNVKSLKSKKEKILKAAVDGMGYYTVALCENGKAKTFKVHQLVAITFLGHEQCGYKLVVNHIDHNKLNNNLNNLEIVTFRENIIKGFLNKGNYKPFKRNVKRKYRVGGPKYVYWHKHNKKYQATYIVDGKFKFLGYYDTEEEAKNVVLNFISNK